MTRLRRLFSALAVLLALASLQPSPARAHEITPAIADVEVGQERVTLSIRIALESLLSGINLAEVTDSNNAPEAALYDRFRVMSPAELDDAFRKAWPRISQGFVVRVGEAPVELEIDDLAIPAIGNEELVRSSVMTLSGALPEGDTPVMIGWQASYGALIVRQVGAGEDAYEAFLMAGNLSEPLARFDIPAESGRTVFARYVAVAFEYMVLSGANILFIFGLFVFVSRLGPLFGQVAAFTLAHAITLSLTAYGVLSVPGGIIYPLIAASVVFIGLDNIFGSGSLRMRVALVFAFGLLHGLGFAEALAQFPIAPNHRVEGLIGFNLGVALAQLAVIAAAFLLVGVWFRKRSWYRPRIVVPVSALIALIGAYLAIERTGLFALPPLPYF
ncbi:MAG: HupE/UreJ family protein [Pseudomonadota bacterium]